MSLIHFISEKIILPLGDFITSQSVSQKLDFLLKSQYWTREEIDRFQTQKLKQLIQHAAETVPYYNDLFRDLSIQPTDIQTKQDLQKLPILTKAIIKKEGIERFTSSAYLNKKKVRRNSSGSTGEPLCYYTSKEAYSMNLAANLRGWYAMSFRLGDKFVKLSQRARTHAIKRLQDKATRNLYLAVDPLEESNFQSILQKFEVYKPKVVRCYPDPLLFLARYKQKHPEFSFNPSVINTTGSTLHPEARREIEHAFNCKIYDSYSCEGNPCVFECPSHECYHSTEEYGISEVINENGVVINSGVGRLISTDLWNLAHPFIRYDTQDNIEIDDSPCSCGRSLLKVKRILGRNSDVLTLPNGRKFVVHNFTIFFSQDALGLSKAIDQFQVNKKRDNSIVFRLVVNKSFNDSIKEHIISFWSKEFHTPVDINIVENIPLGENGKRRFVINE